MLKARKISELLVEIEQKVQKVHKNLIKNRLNKLKRIISLTKTIVYYIVDGKVIRLK